MSLTKSHFWGGAVPDDQFGNFEKPSYSGGKGGCYEVGADSFVKINLTLTTA